MHSLPREYVIVLIELGPISCSDIAWVYYHFLPLLSRLADGFYTNFSQFSCKCQLV